MPLTYGSYLKPDKLPELRETPVALMREDPQSALLTELLVDFDKGLQE